MECRSYQAVIQLPHNLETLHQILELHDVKLKSKIPKWELKFPHPQIGDMLIHRTGICSAFIKYMWVKGAYITLLVVKREKSISDEVFQHCFWNFHNKPLIEGEVIISCKKRRP